MNVVNKVRCRSTAMLMLSLMVMMSLLVTPSIGLAAQTTIDFGTAASFAVLAGSAITNTGPTTIDGTAGGNIGLYPGADPTLVTFPGQADVTLTGTVHLFDAVAAQAQVDLLAAYNDAAGRASDQTISADLGGSTLTPGVYTSASSIGITGILTLDGGGDPNALFIFQAGSTLTTATGSEIRLINGAQASRVFWQVGSSATLGTNSIFVGHILAMQSITLTTGAEVQGQLLALNGAVTLDSNEITNDGVTVAATTGSLTVTKVVQGSVGDMTLPSFVITVTGPQDFTDTRTLANGTSYTWDNLVPGAYTVTESRTGLSNQWTVSGEGTVQVMAGQTALATITNSFTPDTVPTLGALTVTKVLIGNVSGLTLPNFVITVSGPQGFSEARILVYGASYTWENLVPGTYTVTESRIGLSSAWTVSGEGTVQVLADQTALTTITNSYLAEVVLDGANPGSGLPNTGEDTRLMTYSGLFLLMLGLLVWWTASRKTYSY